MKRYLVVLTTTLMFLGVVSPLSLSPARAQTANIDELVRNAKTSADHQAIAGYYKAQAAEAKAKNEEMQKVLADHSNQPRSSATSKHCDKMAQDYKDIETQATALAEEHEKMAAQAR